MTSSVPEDIPTTPDAYEGTFNLQSIALIGHVSRIGADGQRTAFDDSQVRYCRMRIDENVNEPHSRQGSFWHNLVEGFEQYVPHPEAGNRTDILCEWALANSVKNHIKTLNEVTMGSNVMTDRTTLMKIASTPYANHRHGWKLEAIRIGNTLIVCPRAIEGEQRHFTEGGGLKGVYRLEMLKSILTQSKDGGEQKTSTEKCYHRVMTANLTDGIRGLKILYTAKVDCVNRETTNPIEIRTQEKRLRPKDLLDKMLKWHILSRLSESRQLLLGVRTPDDKLEGIEVLPTNFMRDFAERENAWKTQPCFTFLYEVLERMRNQLQDKPEGHRLTVSYSPKSPKVHFEVHEACDHHQLFVSQIFWRVFAVNNVA
ncbi:Protein dom-3 [Aphelenchoides avenae]|nr:Protein dom-3 [Aphelenchus avenae]